MTRQQPTLFDGARATMEQSIARTIEALQANGPYYRHWACAWSGGKDSTLLVTLLIHLIESGHIQPPETLTILQSDTRIELPPLTQDGLRVCLEKIRAAAEAGAVIALELGEDWLLDWFDRIGCEAEQRGRNR